MAYYPYGEERTSTSDGREKFGTYFRDMVGQDYADQRYYSSINGRFWTPDAGGIKTATPSNPLSWNRYAYTLGDPINFNDVAGKNAYNVEDGDEQCDEYDVGYCYDDGDEGDGATFTTGSKPACPPGQILVGDVGSASCVDLPGAGPTYPPRINIPGFNPNAPIPAPPPPAPSGPLPLSTCLFAPSWFVQLTYGPHNQAPTDPPNNGGGNGLPFMPGRSSKNGGQVPATDDARPGQVGAGAGAVQTVVNTVGDCAPLLGPNKKDY
jgi:RHS repeat-associated protein